MGAVKFYAHSLEGAPRSEWQPLDRHLLSVAVLAEGFAAAFESGPWGRYAGLWHDVGKYQPEFQAYIRGQGARIGHSAAGALLARALAGEKNPESWLPLAFVIAGHHAGLANLRTDAGKGAPSALQWRLQSAEELKRAKAVMPENLLRPPPTQLPPWLSAASESMGQEEAQRRWEFWTRFLFSSLVDADFLDTEEFYRGEDRAAATAGFDSIEDLQERLDAHIDAMAATKADSPLNRLRNEVLEACREASERSTGAFSLTVPTGGGKTLSAMSFALRHCRRHGLRRVIVVIPFTSIIEQNAAVYRQALGEANVIEHHSNLDPEKETRRNKLASENWDAPVVVTTSVQFFESLFANRTSRCRKLHNVARSVVLLDEVQTLPPGLLAPILDAMRELSTGYGCSIVLSTATQPALAARKGFEQGLESVREIIPAPRRLSRRLTRYEVRWPARLEQPVQWERLAAEVEAHQRVLAIVHQRADARRLAQLLSQRGTFHLSALMCASHREAVLKRVQATLQKPEAPCRLVSTQLVEAGVDIDFPVVYRALAGLDSLTQAGGRCNREGLVEKGQLIIFRAPSEPPPGVLRRGLEKMVSLLRLNAESETPPDITDPERVEEYFRLLYATGELDSEGIQAERQQLNFATVARRFRLIQDDWQGPLVVPYGDCEKRLDRLRDQGPSRETLRALQPYTVSIPRRQRDALYQSGALELVHDTVYALAQPYRHLYDLRYGLMAEDADQGPDAGSFVA